MEPITPSLDGATEQVIDTQDATTEQVEVPAEPSADAFTSLDPATLPDELQTAYKQMQADYTRKTQEIAEARKATSAYEDMANNPGFKRMVQNFEEYGTLEAPKAVEPVEESFNFEEFLLKSIENPQYFKDVIREEARKIAAEQVAPLSQESIAREVTNTITDLRTRYPDFVEYEDQIAELIERGESDNPERLYKDLTYDKLLQRGMNAGVRSVQSRSNAATPTPSMASASNRKIESMADAMQAALKEHGYGE